MTTPIDSFDACEEFFVLVVESHIVTAALTMMGMTSVTDIPSKKFVPDGIDTQTKSKEERKRILNKIACDLVNLYVSISYNVPSELFTCIMYMYIVPLHCFPYMCITLYLLIIVHDCHYFSIHILIWERYEHVTDIQWNLH